MKAIVVLVQFILISPISCQSKVAQGIIVEVGANEPIIFAKIYDTENEKLYQSDIDGRFKIKIDKGDTISLYVNYTGYVRQLSEVLYSADTIRIGLKTGLVGGVQDHLAAQEYYKKNKLQIDSLETLYNNYDMIIKSLSITQRK